MAVMNDVVDGYRWSAERVAWLDESGEPVPPEKADALQQRATEIWQQKVMARLDAVRSIFHQMDAGAERKAAHEWLRATYNL